MCIPRWVAKIISRNGFYVRKSVYNLKKKTTKLGKKKFISSKDVLVKSTETGQRWKHARRLPYHRTMAEKKDKDTLPKTRTIRLYTLQRCRVTSCLSFPPSFCSKVIFLGDFISALFLYFLHVHPYLVWYFAETFPLVRIVLINHIKIKIHHSYSTTILLNAICLTLQSGRRFGLTSITLC